MPKYMLTGEHWVVVDRFGPNEDQWEEILPEVFEAENDEVAHEVVKKLVERRGRLRNTRLWRMVEEQSS